jgi:hypothetical protein
MSVSVELYGCPVRLAPTSTNSLKTLKSTFFLCRTGVTNPQTDSAVERIIAHLVDLGFNPNH